MVISTFFKDGLLIDKYKIALGKTLQQFGENITGNYVNLSEGDTLIMTYKSIEFCFKSEKLIYWQIDTHRLHLSFGGTKTISKVNFADFLKFLNQSKIEWIFQRELCFNDQIAVRIVATKIDFIFAFDSRVDGKVAIIGSYAE
jgi:hypothetical protein